MDMPNKKVPISQNKYIDSDKFSELMDSNIDKKPWISIIQFILEIANLIVHYRKFR